MDTEEAEDQALEDSEAGECRDTGPGQDTQGYTLYHGRSDQLVRLEIERRYLYLTHS